MTRSKRKKVEYFDYAPRAHAIFCDDVRKEATGKLLLIGVYSGILYVSQIPVTLPQLIVLVEVSVPADTLFSRLETRATLSGEEVVKFELQPDQLNDIFAKVRSAKQPEIDWIRENDPGDGEAMGLAKIQVQMRLENLEIKREGVLRLIVEADGKRIRANSLMVKRQPSS